MTRRQAVGFVSCALGALALRRLAHASDPSATPVARTVPDASTVLSPELTQGPYYIDLERVRRDITEGKPGVPLQLQFEVLDAKSGRPVTGAAVDLWHCDAQGVYSGFSSQGFGPHPGGPPPPWMIPGSSPSEMAGGALPPLYPPGGPGFHPPGPPQKPENHLTFLRGVQLTDNRGIAEFATIFPGWYSGRTTHVHLRVHQGGVVEAGRYQHGHICHTGQIFFPEEITDDIYRTNTYARKKQGRMHLAQDGIFRQGGSRIAELKLRSPGEPRLGYVGRVILVVDPAATPPTA